MGGTWPPRGEKPLVNRKMSASGNTWILKGRVGAKAPQTPRGSKGGYQDPSEGLCLHLVMLQANITAKLGVGTKAGGRVPPIR